MTKSGIRVLTPQGVQNALWMTKLPLCRERIPGAVLSWGFWARFTWYLWAPSSCEACSMQSQVGEPRKTVGPSEITGLFSNLMRQAGLGLFNYGTLLCSRGNNSIDSGTFYFFSSSAIFSSSLLFQRLAFKISFYAKKEPRKRTVANSPVSAYLLWQASASEGWNSY